MALSRANDYVDCHEELQLSWFIADALFSFIIPFSLILIFNIRIVRLIKQHAQSSISKQSIMLRHQKARPTKKTHRNGRGSRQEDSQSIVYSPANSSTLQGGVFETEMVEKFISNKKKKNKNGKSLYENQVRKLEMKYEESSGQI